MDKTNTRCELSNAGIIMQNDNVILRDGVIILPPISYVIIQI